MANVICKGTTFYAPKGAYYEGNVRIDGDFIVPARTHFWGRLVVTGRLELGKKSSVALDVECGSAIVGSHARIKGPLVAAGDVSLLDHCVVYSVNAGGRVMIRPNVRVGDVTSADTIVVHGKIKSGKLTGKSMKVFGD
jgi:cytoskeletal protein CcmA (bactofilin family)